MIPTGASRAPASASLVPVPTDDAHAPSTMPDTTATIVTLRLDMVPLRYRAPASASMAGHASLAPPARARAAGVLAETPSRP
jgi:hypothetical protein